MVGERGKLCSKSSVHHHEAIIPPTQADVLAHYETSCNGATAASAHLLIESIGAHVLLYYTLHIYSYTYLWLN